MESLSQLEKCFVLEAKSETLLGRQVPCFYLQCAGKVQGDVLEQGCPLALYPFKCLLITSKQEYPLPFPKNQIKPKLILRNAPEQPYLAQSNHL